MTYKVSSGTLNLCSLTLTTGRFLWVTETVYGKMAATIEIHPSSVTTILWTQVSLCCKKQTME